MNLETEKYLIENDVSVMTKLSVQTLRNWRFLGKGIPYTKAGRSVRYRLDDVLNFMNAGRIIPREAVK